MENPRKTITTLVFPLSSHSSGGLGGYALKLIGESPPRLVGFCSYGPHVHMPWTWVLRKPYRISSTLGKRGKMVISHMCFQHQTTTESRYEAGSPLAWR